MNDLEQIRTLYSDVPAPDSAERAAGAALAALRAEMDSPAMVPAPRRRARRRVRLALAGACAALGIAAVLNDSDSSPRAGSVVAWLDQAAKAAAGSDEPWQLAPGQYWYVSKKLVTIGPAARCNGPVREERPRGGFLIRGGCGTMSFEEWEAIDDSGRLRVSRPAGPDGKVERDDHLSDPHPKGADRAYIDLAGVNIPYRDLIEMPGDELAERVREDAERQANRPAGWTRVGVLFLFVGNLLADEALSPDQRAALYRMIAGQPGIRSLGEVTDPEGRRGVAVGHGDDGHETVIIFDPDTSRVLATGTGLAGRTPPAGFGHYTLFQQSGIVNSTSETP
jgi:hypothetical protein